MAGLDGRFVTRLTQLRSYQILPGLHRFAHARARPGGSPELEAREQELGNPEGAHKTRELVFPGRQPENEKEMHGLSPSKRRRVVANFCGVTTPKLERQIGGKPEALQGGPGRGAEP